MQRKSETRKKRGLSGNAGDGGRLLEEIEALSRALSSKKPGASPKSLPSEIRQRMISAGKSQFTEPRAKPRALADDSPPQLPPQKDKRSSWSTSSSIWNWKPLRALSHIRHRRFDCRFTLHVHSVEGLSPSFNGTALCVRWKRNIAELGLCTRHGRVSDGVAKFEETLEHRCAVYGSRGGGPHHTAKYEARQFILYASVVGAPAIDLGKHRVDLTRLLPLTLEELETGSTGKWSTSFKLSGKGKNASLNVSFAFSVLDGGDLAESGGRKKVSETDFLSKNRMELPSRSAEDSTFLDEVSPISRPEFDAISPQDDSSVLTSNASIESEEQDTVCDGDSSISRNDVEEDDAQHNADEDYGELSLSDTELLLQELESALDNLPIFETEELEDQIGEEGIPVESTNMDSGFDSNLDDAIDTVADEFLSMLDADGSSSDPESPRERLWQEFKNEASADLENIFDLEEDFDLSSFVEAAEAEQHRSRGEMLEHEEAEALMNELGFDENSFFNSPPEGVDLRGDLRSEEAVDLPPVGEGVGPFLQTKDGGFLRTMNPSVFGDSRQNKSLIMQVSSPVVVPAEMGSTAMEVLQSLASEGIERLSVQASKLMPLEDISGKTIQQVCWDADSSPKVNERQSRRRPRSADHDYVSLEDLAPLAMEKIESLSIEGLRIQSGMSEKEAPGDLNSLGAGGAVGLPLPEVNAGGDEADGLMGLSISLEEWMKLDSGVIEEDQISERTSNILAAHHATSTDLVPRRAGRREKTSGKGIFGNDFTVALMVQLRDPLRNFEPVGAPMLSLIQVERVLVPPKPRFYCTVSDEGNGEPADEEPEVKVNADEANREDEGEVNGGPQFKITGVHVAGLRSDPRERKGWGSSSQRQSGSRWLLANGMGKVNKHPLMKSTPSEAQKGETLWSISSRVNAGGSRWKELPAHKRNPNIILHREKP